MGDWLSKLWNIRVMEHSEDGILRGVFNDTGKSLTDNIEWKNEIKTVHSVPSPWEGNAHYTHTLLTGKILILTVVISDFYFIVARIFQTFKSMCVLLL